MSKEFIFIQATIERRFPLKLVRDMIITYSQFIAIRSKFELQEVYFSGKQYTLHCLIIKPGIGRYNYHLLDEAKLDPVFEDEVLDDILTKKNMRNETVMIENNNASTQYKSTYAFYLLQQIAKFNVTLVRIYEAARCGKGLIDSMSTFGFKGILRRDVIGNEEWFLNSAEIFSYCSMRGDPLTSCTPFELKQLDQERSEKKGLLKNSCLVQHVTFLAKLQRCCC